VAGRQNIDFPWARLLQLSESVSAVDSFRLSFMHRRWLTCCPWRGNRHQLAYLSSLESARTVLAPRGYGNGQDGLRWAHEAKAIWRFDCDHGLFGKRQISRLQACSAVRGP
jgi:hypothetical protein